MREDLWMELEGVIEDVKHGDGFDEVCLRTVERVRDELKRHDCRDVRGNEVW